ncbi:MAG: DUF5916 domain-containing protein [Bacteroidota bacterium]
MKATFTTLFLSLFLHLAIGQSNSRPNQQDYGLNIQRAIDEIRVDGIIEEKTWQKADIATDFWQKSPKDDIKAVLETEMMVSYDDNFLYVAAICHDSTNHVITTLKRDVGFWDSDGVGVVLDPLNQATSGFMFGTSPYGVQTEVLLGGGSGSENYNGQWDNRWFVETKRYQDKWTVEMAIPFKTLRYEEGRSTWGINFIRNDKKNNRIDGWARIPIQFWMIDLGYTGRLQWDAPPEKTKGNIAIIPYMTGSYNQDFEEDEAAVNEFDVGLDAKIALSSSLNLDLTLNPDFSQVEVDQQVTNLTRFNIFLPERRTFFLENSDIFTTVGFPLIQPFFSRRIGLDEDGRAVPIAFGARLTGNITGTTRIGVLNTQTRATDDQLAQNYSAVAVTQRVLKRSRVSAMFTNRQAFGDEGEMASDDYGRNASVKFNYSSEDGRWEGWAGGHKSFKEGFDSDDYFYQYGGGYGGKRLSAVVNHAYVGTNYFADMGFVNLIENTDSERDTTIRIGFHSLFNSIEYRTIPENTDVLNQHAFLAEHFTTMDRAGKLLELAQSIGYQFEFANSSSVALFGNYTETDLRFPFGLTDDEPLPVGRYRYSQIGLEYSSDERKFFQYQLELGGGQFYNGTLASANVSLLYRIQPWGNFGIDIEYNNLDFPDPYGAETIWAFSPRIDINFNRNLFWTTFLQYNTQADNFNINSRFWWRFAPMSDLFVVYTDNYSIENFGPKTRALVLKLSYWLAL